MLSLSAKIIPQTQTFRETSPPSRQVHMFTFFTKTKKQKQKRRDDTVQDKNTCASLSLKFSGRL